jgi:hypothetical protein
MGTAAQSFLAQANNLAQAHKKARKNVSASAQKLCAAASTSAQPHQALLRR